MAEKEYEIPTDKRKSTIFFIVMIVLSAGLLIFSAISFHDASMPKDLIEISCEFNAYETQQRTRSISYDLLLFSEEHDKPFELDFFDGYKKQLSAEAFCDGSTYILLVLPTESSYVIYSCFDVEGNPVMSKREAYTKSQGPAHIALTVFLIMCICFWGLLISIIHHPERFGDGMKKLFFGKR